MNFELTEITAVAGIIGLVEVIKNFNIDNRFLPVVDIILGIMFAIAINGTVTPVIIINGIFLGLTAAGLYRSTKVVAGGQ